MKELTMPSWIGPWEIAIVVIIALLIFGPRKLPELGSSFGKSIRGFKKGLKEGQDELNRHGRRSQRSSPMRRPRSQGHHRRGDDDHHDRGGHCSAEPRPTSRRHRHCHRPTEAALLGHLREGRRVVPAVHRAGDCSQSSAEAPTAG